MLKLELFSFLFLVTVALSSGITALGPSVNELCKFTTTNGRYKYDVSNLIGKGTAENGYYLTKDDYAQELIYNLCAGVKTTGQCTDGSAACQKDGLDEWWSLGTTNSALGVELSAAEGGPAKGFKIIYSHGDEGWSCQTADNRRQLTVVFLCDISAETPLLSTYRELEACAYEFSITSKEACPIGYVDGCRYDGMDLTSLVGKGPGYEGRWKALESTADVQFTYWFNICEGVLIGNSTCTTDTAVCSQYYNHGQQYISVGRVDSLEWRDHPLGAATGAVVTFSGGSSGHSTEVTYVCNENVPDLRIGAAKTGANKIIKFEAQTRLVCGRKNKPDPNPDPKPEPKPDPQPEPTGMPAWLITVTALGSVGIVSTAAVVMFFISRRYPRKGLADNKTEMTATLISKE